MVEGLFFLVAEGCENMVQGIFMYRVIGFPPLTWTQFYSIFMAKYVPHTLRNRKKDKFSRLE